MKKALALIALVAAALATALAQTVPPELFVSRLTILTTATTTTCDATAAVRSADKPKTYAAAASVASGTGTAVVNVQGSMDKASWSTIGTITVPTTTTTAVVGLTSYDQWMWVCGNVTTLSGATPTLSLTAGF